MSSKTNSSVRTIYQSKQEQQDHQEQFSSSTTSPKQFCAYHVKHAFQSSDLNKLNQLRLDIDLDLSRPTCPRRYFTELPKHTNSSNANSTESTNLNQNIHIQQYTVPQPFVGQMIDTALKDWGLGHLQAIPKYRFLEYNEGGNMQPHQDGFSLHPVEGITSVATMLIYLSSCTKGGATALYEKPIKKRKKKKKRLTKKQRKEMERSISQPQQEQKDKEKDIDIEKEGTQVLEPKLIEAIQPVYNTALIFPHPWLHAGLPVVAGQPKICLRVDLCPKES